MSELDIFAAIILAVIVLTVLAAIGALGVALPWRVVRNRGPEVEATAGGPWLGLLCGGVLLLLMLAWCLHSAVRVQSTIS